jgi:hypothetical protein
MVSLKVSQFVPSSQESSPPPVGGTPVGVPIHVNAGPAVVMVPAGGLAAKALKTNSAEMAHKAHAIANRNPKIPDWAVLVFFISSLPGLS